MVQPMNKNNTDANNTSNNNINDNDTNVFEPRSLGLLCEHIEPTLWLYDALSPASPLSSARNRPAQHAGWRVWRQPPNTNESCGRSRAQTPTASGRHSGKTLAAAPVSPVRAAGGLRLAASRRQVSNSPETPGGCSKL